MMGILALLATTSAGALNYASSYQWGDPRFGIEIGQDLGGAGAGGDFNGDGIPDLVTCEAGNDGSSGMCAIFLGGNGVFDADLDRNNLNGENGTLVCGAGTSTSCGNLLDRENVGTRLVVGDFNGDGRDDLLLSTDTSPTNADYHVVFGADSFDPVTVTADLSGADGFSIDMDGLSLDTFARDVGRVNLNGDAFDDIVVVNDGTAFVLFGRLFWSASIDLTTEMMAISIDGISRFAEFGAGDVNADGMEDLIIGDHGHGTLGAVAVIFGALGPVSVDVDNLMVGQGYLQPGTGLVRNLGVSVASGDVNGDTIDDLVMASRFGNDGGVVVAFGGSGIGPIDLSDPGNAGRVIRGATEANVEVAEFDGALGAEIVITSGNASGALVRLALGGANREDIDDCNLRGTQGLEFVLPSVWNRLEGAIIVGDLNRGGLPELLLPSNRGRHYLAFGETLPVLFGDGFERCQP